jgi:hypothetical protein
MTFEFACDLHLLNPSEFNELEAKVLEIQRMLAALAQRLQGRGLARS